MTDMATAMNCPGAAAARMVCECRRRDIAQHVDAGRLSFLDGVDKAYSVAVWSGMSDAFGDDAVQAVLVRACRRLGGALMAVHSFDSPDIRPDPSISAAERVAKRGRPWWVIEGELQRRRTRKKRGKPSFATLRVSELNRLYLVRYLGGPLPDDDDGRDSAEIMIDHLAVLSDPDSRIRMWARRWAPWLDLQEQKLLLLHAKSQHTRYTADNLARRLNLTIT
jgi:hypothetical protein